MKATISKDKEDFNETRIVHLPVGERFCTARVRHANPDADADPYANQHANTHTDRHRDGHTHADLYADLHTYGDFDARPNIYPHEHVHVHAHVIFYAHTSATDQHLHPNARWSHFCWLDQCSVGSFRQQ